MRPTLSYRPHDGHADQMRQLSLAAALARKLSRQLVLPPLLHHKDAGSCSNSNLQLLSRPPISSLLNLSALNVKFIERADFGGGLRCEAAAALSCAAADLTWLSFDVAPPHAKLAFSPQHLHFQSMLFSLQQRPSSCRFANWEAALVEGPCRIRYRRDVLSQAMAVIGNRLPKARGNAHLVAAHVRALPEASSKRDRPTEWMPRVRALAESAAGGTSSSRAALYVATDDVARVLPLLAEVWRSLPHAVAPIVLTRENFTAAELGSVHADPAFASLAVDIAAVLHAKVFAPSPSSGLSMHLEAMRRCAGRGGGGAGPARCMPAVRAAAGGLVSSTGCGGELPRAVALRPH